VLPAVVGRLRPRVVPLVMLVTVVPAWMPGPPIISPTTSPEGTVEILMDDVPVA